MSRQKRIEQRLREELNPLILNVEDESNQHHAPKGMETHFKIVAISSKFVGLSRVKRHRLLHEWLKEEWTKGLHALSLHLFSSEEEWKKTLNILKSPSCRDGFEQ